MRNCDAGMGGALAVRLAADLGSELPAMVLLAPYLDMPAPIQRLAQTSRFWRWLLPYFPSGGQRSIHDQTAAARGLGHGILTPEALLAFYETMQAGRDALPRATAPTLMLQSREDNRIAATSAEGAFGALGSTEKKLVWVEGAGHVITVDFGHERVFGLVVEWLDAHRALSPAGRAPRLSRRSP
jgi:carboxylesterase